MYPLTIKPRRGTIDEWNEHEDTILREHELVVIKNDNPELEPKFKLGDGVTPFKNLPYVTMHQAFRDGIMYSSNGRDTIYVRIDYIN